MNNRAIDPHAIYERAQELAFPRYPGTEGDRRAIGIVRSWFEAAGLEVGEEQFSYDVRPAFRALRALLVLCAGLVVASAILAPERPLGALALVAVALVSGGVFLGWAPWLEGIYRRDGPTETANVVGWRRATPAGARRITVILIAHHDSKSQSLTLPFRAASTLGALLGVLTLAGLELAAVLGRSAPAGWLAASAGLATISLVALATLRSGNLSPGGVDNAGSVSLLAELARSLVVEVAEDVELVFLSPGAEEDHMVGAMRWLDRHEAEWGDEVFAINIDGAGIPGRVALLERFGFGRRFSATLSRIAREAASELDLRVRGTLLPPAMGVDAIPFAHRGIESLTLASGSLSRAVAAVHSRHDVGTNLDVEALDDVARLARSMVVRLASRERG